MPQTSINFEKLIADFNLDVRETATGWQGCCPVHGGDNPSAFIAYRDNNIWQCFTHGCHEEFGCGSFGFVKGMLARDNPGVTNAQVYEWIESAGLKVNKVPQKFRICSANKQVKPISSRERFLDSVQIPSPYYLGRGFQAATLKKFDVGDCTNSGKPMSGRALIPIYDEDRRYLVGCSGRCIKGSEFRWRHSKDFPKSQVLYNYWYARNEIKRTKTAILVEGPAKVWRLEEAGIHCAMAIFGTNIQLGQLKQLAKTGATNVVIWMDGDEPGKKAAERIAKKIGSMYNVIIADLGILDIDETSPEEIKEKINDKSYCDWW